MTEWHCNVWMSSFPVSLAEVSPVDKQSQPALFMLNLITACVYISRLSGVGLNLSTMSTENVIVELKIDESKRENFESSLIFYFCHIVRDDISPSVQFTV